MVNCSIRCRRSSPGRACAPGSAGREEAPGGAPGASRGCEGAYVYLAGRTSICMKLLRALTLVMRICVPVFGFFTLPCGLVES